MSRKQKTSFQFEADRFGIERVTYEHAGGMHAKDVIRHPGSVVIVPWLKDGEICLIRNYRVAVDRRLVELPAGTLDKPGENPLEAAHRELREETGFTAGTMHLVRSFYPAPGMLDERMHLFLATALTAHPPAREAGEDIENLIVPWQEARAMALDGRIEDAKTIVGLLSVEPT